MSLKLLQMYSSSNTAAQFTCCSLVFARLIWSGTQETHNDVKFSRYDILQHQEVAAEDQVRNIFQTTFQPGATGRGGSASAELPLSRQSSTSPGTMVLPSGVSPISLNGRLKKTFLFRLLCYLGITCLVCQRFYVYSSTQCLLLSYCNVCTIDCITWCIPVASFRLYFQHDSNGLVGDSGSFYCSLRSQFSAYL